MSQMFASTRSRVAGHFLSLGLVLLIGALLWAPLPLQAQTPVRVFTYYDFPPFVGAGRKGLATDFVALLNRHAQGRYQFKLEIYPRKRLDSLLDHGAQGVVLFVHWSYMGDPDKNRYLWGPVLMHDQNELISHIDHPIDYDGTPNSLYGLRFGGVLGRRYVQFREAMEQGYIYREDAPREVSNINKLLAGRIDVTTIPKPVYHHLSEKMDLGGKLYVSPTPRNRYTRHLMVTPELVEEHRFLTELVQALPGTPEWQALLERYGYSDAQPPLPSAPAEGQ